MRAIDAVVAPSRLTIRAHQQRGFDYPMVCINSIELAQAFLSAHEQDLSTPPMPFNRHIPLGFMRYLPPRTYATYRHAFGRALADRSLHLRAAPSVRHQFADSYLLVTGSIDVADLLVWIWYELARHPKCLDTVSADTGRAVHASATSATSATACRYSAASRPFRPVRLVHQVLYRQRLDDVDR